MSRDYINKVTSTISFIDQSGMSGLEKIPCRANEGQKAQTDNQ